MLEAKSESKPYLPPLIVDTEEGTKAESKFESNCKPAPLLKSSLGTRDSIRTLLLADAIE